jgi:subfamily B ATP-binding cassette protein MsbA
MSKKNIFFQLYPFLKPHQWLLIGAVIFASIKSISGYIFPLVLGKIIDAIKSGTFPAEKLNYFLGVLLLFFVSLTGVYFLRSFLPSLLGTRVKTEMRIKLYRHLQRLSASFHDQKRTGEITSRMVTDIEQMDFLVGRALPLLTLDLISFIPFCAFGWLVSKRLTLIALVLCFTYGIIFRVMLPRLKEKSYQGQKKLGQISGEVTEKMGGIKVIQSFVSEKREEKAFSRLNQDYYRLSIERSRLGSIFSSLSEIMPSLGRVLILWTGIHLVLNGIITVGNLVTFVLYLQYIFNPIIRISETSLLISTALGAAERVFDFFEAQPEIKNVKTPLKKSKIEGKIEFKRVCFNYPIHSGKRVLENISFLIPPGKTVALVGPSGAGKTTLVDLLSRFYDPQEGEILIDDINIKNMDLAFLRKNIGTVMQESILFSGTIEENIRLGKPNASFEEIRKAAQQAYAEKFIMKFEDGFKTIIGERGRSLSGGEKQRISIARAFLKNPPILILDEATSSLDSETEGLIQAALRKLLENRTTFVIAHRLTTVLNADLIIVIDQGKIIEKGTHFQLLSKRGLYANLYQKQFKSQIEQDKGVKNESKEEEEEVAEKKRLTRDEAKNEAF